MSSIMLSLFDASGIMARPWAEAGYEAICVDIDSHHQGRHDNVREIRADVRDWWRWLLKGDVAFAAAFPPCTHLSSSGARWWADKGPARLAEAAELVEAAWRACEWIGAPYLIENPVGRLSSIWRQPDHMFDPCDYGDPYTKKTCLWTGCGFVMPPKRPVPVTEPGKIHRMSPSADRARQRSLTPPGFAQAVFEANAPERMAA